MDLDKEQFYHVPVDGHVYYMDTSSTHIAVNWGPNIRTHLNIRILLPHFDSNKRGIHLTVDDSKIEWKQESYIELMGFINKSVKTGIVTGFEGTDSKNLYLNTECPELFDSLIDKIRRRNVEIICNRLS